MPKSTRQSGDREPVGMRTLRYAIRAFTAAAAARILVAVAITVTLVALPGVAGPAPSVPPALTVPEASVLSSPYKVELAANGELRVLSFPDALVSSVVVAKPWLLTVLVQGHDVVLQAKATSGETQVIAYAGGAGTLWNVVIAPHKPVASRIVVSASPPEAAGSSPPRAAQAVTGPASPGSPPMSSPLGAFVAALRPEQKAAFDAWQRQPTMERLTAFLATLDTTQRAEFTKLAGAGDVSVPRAQAAPRVVETMTVIHASPEPPAQAGQAPVPPAAARQQGAPVDGQSLYVYPTDVPAGITVTAQAEQAGSGLIVRYAIHDGLGVWLQDGRVSASDGHGTAVALKDDGPHAVAPGADARGTVNIAASAMPVTLRWTWTKVAAQRIPLLGIEQRVEQGTAAFYVLVTH
jgi:hypothetical protein